MAKKKTLMVDTHKVGADWSINVSGRGEDIFQLFGSMVRSFAGEKDLPIINATDPFPVSKARKKKAIKALEELKTKVKEA